MVVTLLLMISVPVMADLKVDDVWSRATPPGMPMGAVYGVIRNAGTDVVEIVGLETPVARAAEIHESVEIDGMMRMREIAPFEVQPGETIRLEPGGIHMMLMGLKSQLLSGQRFPVDIHLSDGSSITVESQVGGFGQMAMPEIE